jgi:predicted double-glycine peptidase
MDGSGLTLFISIGALVVAALVALGKTLDKSLSIREHEEFRANVKDRLGEIKADYQREANRLENRIQSLEQTRPTTGELEARLDTKK